MSSDKYAQMSKREIYQILPTNLGAGVFAPSRNGLSQMIFELPQLPAIMNGKSLRINGTFTLKQGNGNAPTNGTNFLKENPTGDIFIDSRTGVLSCFETLTIGSLRGTTYSSIKNYNRLMSSVLPLNESTQNYLNGVDTHYGCLSKDVSTAKKCDRSFDFSVPLNCGYLQGQPINMWITQGHRITITLAQDSFVIHNNKQRNGNSSAGKSNGGAYYELSDVTISFEVDLPDDEGQNAIRSMTKGQMTYNSYSSFYNVIVSNDHNLSLLFNTAKTISVIGNMIPSEWVNNYDYDSSRTQQLLYDDATGELQNGVQIDSYTYTIGGVRVGYDFEIDSSVSQENGTIDAVKNEIELNAIREGWSAGNFIKSIQTELSNPFGSNGFQPRFDRSRYAIVGEDKFQHYNIGLSYDHITEIGQDCRTRPFALRIQSTLPEGKTLNPHSLYLFVLHQNTIVFDNGSVSVLS
jgi:hypothetical protein